MKIEKRNRSRQLSRQSVEFRRGRRKTRSNYLGETISRRRDREEKSEEKTASGSINLIIYDSWLLAPFHFLPSLSTYKHRKRNLIKYQSLFAIRVWPMGMLDTRPQFWISIGAYSVTGLKGLAKWRINTVYTWKRHSWYLLHFKAQTRTFQFEFSKFPI